MDSPSIRITAQKRRGDLISGGAIVNQGRRSVVMYSYRSKAAVSEQHKEFLHQEFLHLEREKIFKGLALRRQLLSQVISTVRTLTTRRNDQIAQALEDGLTVAKIAALTGESAWTIRTIGLSYEGLYPSRTGRDEHLGVIRSITAEIAAAEGKRALLEEQRERLVVRACRVTECDVLDLAMVSGMTSEQVHKTTRGLSRRSSRNDRPAQPGAADLAVDVANLATLRASAG
jgi:hypothetical protein